MAAESTSSSTSDSPAQPAQAVAGMIPTVEGEGLQPIYANFVKVTTGFEELILEFGLNPNVPGTPVTPVTISERLVMNYFTAKRLLAILQFSVQRHEQAFGVLETDVLKRVRQGRT